METVRVFSAEVFIFLAWFSGWCLLKLTLVDRNAMALGVLLAGSLVGYGGTRVLDRRCRPSTLSAVVAAAPRRRPLPRPPFRRPPSAAACSRPAGSAVRP